MNPPILPMNLGDIFERTTITIGHGFIRNIILILLFLGIPAILMAIGIHEFYSAIGDLSAKTADAAKTGPDDFLPAIGAFLLFGAVGMIFFIGYLGAHLAVTMVACAELSSQAITWKEALKRTWSKRLLRALGLILLYMLAIMLFGVCAAVVGVLFAKTNSVPAIGVTMGLIFLFIIVMLYLIFRWVFAMTVIAWEDQGVFKSLGRSSELVRGSWWRVFGILFLLGLVSQFAISMISAPVMLVSMWGVYAEYFKFLGTVKEGGAPVMPPELLSKLGSGLGISIAFATMIGMLIQPVYSCVLYFDLRARRGEFIEPEPVTPQTPLPPAREEDPGRFMPPDYQ